MGGIYWDVLGETGVYSQQCQYQKTYSLAAFVFHSLLACFQNRTGDCESAFFALLFTH